MSNNKKNNKNKKNRKNFNLEALEPERFFFGHEKLMPISIGMTRAGKGDAGFPVPRTISSVWLGTLVPLPIYYDNTATDVTWLHNTPNFVRLVLCQGTLSSEAASGYWQVQHDTGRQIPHDVGRQVQHDTVRIQGVKTQYGKACFLESRKRRSRIYVREDNGA